MRRYNAPHLRISALFIATNHPLFTKRGVEPRIALAVKEDSPWRDIFGRRKVPRSPQFADSYSFSLPCLSKQQSWFRKQPKIGGTRIFSSPRPRKGLFQLAAKIGALPFSEDGSQTTPSGSLSLRSPFTLSSYFAPIFRPRSASEQRIILHVALVAIAPSQRTRLFLRHALFP
jgi:hypothetical protein